MTRNQLHIANTVIKNLVEDQAVVVDKAVRSNKNNIMGNPMRHQISKILTKTIVYQLANLLHHIYIQKILHKIYHKVYLLILCEGVLIYTYLPHVLG